MINYSWTPQPYRPPTTGPQYLPPSGPAGIGASALNNAPSRRPSQNPTQNWTPTPYGTGGSGSIGVTPEIAHQNTNIPMGALMLHDSNPVKYPRPVGAPQPRPTTQDSRQGFPPVGGLAQQLGGGLGGGGGYILGSSVGPPSGYGAGLAPASGLGGGLYPSLVSLYR